VLAERDYAWSNGVTKEFTLRAEGNRLQASIDGELLFDVEDTDRPLTGGGAAFVVEEGRIMSEAFAIRP